MARKSADQGRSEAHTQPGADGLDQAARADPVAAELGGADPAALLAGSPELSPVDLLELVAEPSLDKRRGRGRPAGAANRKNADMIAYLEARGHRDPWVTLSLIQSMDTNKLAMMLRTPMQEKGIVKKDEDGNVLYNPPSFADALHIQKSAAEAIMPYHHGKKPQQLELLDKDARRPMMVIGEFNLTQIAGDGFMSAGEKPNEINGSFVRDGEDVSHGSANVLKDNDDPAPTD